MTARCAAAFPACGLTNSLKVFADGNHPYIEAAGSKRPDGNLPE
jgi:hypothetical protein